MNWKRVRKERQRVAYDHILHLYDLAVREVPDHPERARRYIEIVRAISRKHKATLAPAMKRGICKSCNMPLLPGRTAQVRVRPGRTVITCLMCGKVHRYPISVSFGSAGCPASGRLSERHQGALSGSPSMPAAAASCGCGLRGTFLCIPHGSSRIGAGGFPASPHLPIPGAVSSFFADRALDMPGVPIDTLISLILEASMDEGTPVRT
jgi:ribonuclease P protein subunit RPR2